MDDVISTIEMIDEQQALIMNDISPDGRDKLYNQLDAIQDTYIDAVEKYTSYIEEIAAKCLADLVIYNVLFNEFKNAINLYKSVAVSNRKCLDLLVVCFCTYKINLFTIQPISSIISSFVKRNRNFIQI